MRNKGIRKKILFPALSGVAEDFKFDEFNIHSNAK